MSELNPALERMRGGDIALGMILRLVSSSEIVRVAKATGHDFVFVDLQHSLISLESTREIAIAAQGYGVASIVRVRSCDDPDTSRLLDAGVSGIVFPDVGTAEEARRAVERCRFAPRGRRSAMMKYPSLLYAGHGLQRSMEIMDRSTLVGCMVETVQGIENVEAIAGMDGVDVVHIGCNDLLLDMGLPGQFTHPHLQEAVDKVVRACRAAGKFVGLGGDKNLDRQRAHIRNGIQFITTESDVTFMMTEASRQTAVLRDASSVQPASA